MSRPRAIPKYRKHSSGQARCTINGRDYLLGPYQSQMSIREYDHIVREWLASGRSPAFGLESESLTVAMLMVDYLHHCSAYYGRGRKSEYHRIRQALMPLKKLYAAHEAAQCGPLQFKTVRNAIVETGITRGGVNRKMRDIVRMFKWGAAEAKLTPQVYQTLKLIPGLRKGKTAAAEAPPVQPVPMEIVTATAERLPPVVADMVRVQLLTGARPGEICELTAEMIDVTDDVWIASPSNHKNAHRGGVRNICIGPMAQKVLRPYLGRNPSGYLFRPSDSLGAYREAKSAARKTPKNQGNRRGYRNGRNTGSPVLSECYDVDTYRRAITRAAKRADVPHWSPNQLRHSRATEVAKLFGLQSAAATLGHKNVDTTLIYAELDRTKAVEVARQIG